MHRQGCEFAEYIDSKSTSWLRAAAELARIDVRTIAGAIRLKRVRTTGSP